MPNLATVENHHGHSSQGLQSNTVVILIMICDCVPAHSGKSTKIVGAPICTPEAKTLPKI
jgi:hypothetical protein